MANTKAIKQKMRAVSNLGKITRAMEMVARAKMKRAVDAAYATRTFAQLGREIMQNLSELQYEENPFLFPGLGEKSLLVLFGSNKGLCGGYNAQMFRALRTFIHSRPEQSFEVITVGKYATAHAKKLGLTIVDQMPGLIDSPTPDETAQLKNRILRDFLGDEYDRVYLMYTNFESAFSQRPVVRPLLPLSLDYLDRLVESVGGDIQGMAHVKREEVIEEAGLVSGKSTYLFEPSEQVILDYVIPGLIHTQCYQALLESIASEHAARMVAMKSASDNAGTLHDSLSLTYNRARQAGITNELIDIVAGASAVSAG